MTKTFLWASPHKPTEEQISSLGKVVLLGDINPELQKKLSSQELDTDLELLAIELILESKEMTIVQPGGSPAFQLTLGRIMAAMPEIDKDKIIYSFSKRVSQDIPQEDGSIKKIAIFKHEGWI